MIRLKLDPRNLYLTFRYRRWLFFFSLATAVILGSYLIPGQTTKYTATAKLEFADQAAPEDQVERREHQTRLIESRFMRTQVAMRLSSLGYPEFVNVPPAASIEEVLSHEDLDKVVGAVPLNASWEGATDTIVIRAETESEPLSVDIVNIAAQLFISHHHDERERQVVRAMAEASSQIEEIVQVLATLEAQLEDLQEGSKGYDRVASESRLQKRRLAELQADLQAFEDIDSRFAEVSVIEKATRADAYKPMSLGLRISLLALLGLGFGAAVVLLRESLESGSESREDLERQWGTQILGMIPRFEVEAIMEHIAVDQMAASRTDLDQIAFLPAHFATAEKVSASFRYLQSRMESQVTGKGYKTLTITSSLLAEGKTIIASNLAVVFAQSGYRTLLIDAGIHRSFLHNIFGISRSPGLTELLCGMSDLDRVVQSIEAIIFGKFGLQNARTTPGLETLFLLTAGMKTEYPSKLFDRLIFSEILLEARDRYDLILIDGPPVLSVSYASAIASAADAAILTFQPGRTSKEVLTRSKKRLTEEGARVAGIILNEVEVASPVNSGRRNPWIPKPWSEIWSRPQSS